MDLPRRHYSDEEKLHLLANLDLESQLLFSSCLMALFISFIQLHIEPGNSKHG